MAKKQHALLTLVGLGFALAIGVLVVVHALQPDPDAIKAELARKLAELEALPPEQALLKDARAEELLEVEAHSIHAKALRLKLERLHNGLHEAAQRDRAAAKEVPPFLARCKNLQGLAIQELDLRAGEGRSLLASHGGTRFKPSLQEALNEVEKRREEWLRKQQEDLKRLLQQEDGTVIQGLIELQRQVYADMKQGRYADALKRIETFETLKLDADLKLKCREQRDAVTRRARSAAEKLLQQARNLEEEGKAADALRALETALPGYKGFPEADGIEAALRRLKPR